MGDVPRVVTRAALLVVVVLAVAGFLVQYARFVLDYEYLWGLAPLFNPLREANVPTWFSSALLLSSGVALAVVGVLQRREGSRDATWWLVLATVLCLASLDEAANLHELLSRQARRRIRPGFGQVWVLLLGPVALIVVSAYAWFLRSQDTRVRRAFALGAVLFVGGAVGVEIVEILLERSGAGDLAVAMTMMVQEVMELLGAVALLHASMTLLVIVLSARSHAGEAPGGH